MPGKTETSLLHAKQTEMLEVWSGFSVDGKAGSNSHSFSQALKRGFRARFGDCFRLENTV